MEILILGAGDIGYQLGKRLSKEKYDITIIESDPAKAKRAGEQLDAIVVEGHAASHRILNNAGVASKDIVAAMTNDDEVNLLACMIAKKMGKATTIARVRNPELTEDDFALTHEELGVDHVIHPEQETANAIVRLIRQATATALGRMGPAARSATAALESASKDRDEGVAKAAAAALAAVRG